MVHHVIAFSLVWSMIYANLVGVGLIVLQINNVTEPALFLSRILACTTHKKFSVLPMAFLVPAWIYSRLFVLGYVICGLFRNLHFPGGTDDNNVFYTLNLALLSTLFLLNIYWGKMLSSVF
jgi:hypothetical protein